MREGAGKQAAAFSCRRQWPRLASPPHLRLLLVASCSSPSVPSRRKLTTPRGSTTREPRPGEIADHDYHFLSPAAFQARLAAGDFLEHALVHGNYYGTLRAEVMGYLEAGVDVVMDIDVQGAAQVRACEDPAIQRARVDLFVMPPGEHELRARLTGRGTDSEATIALRMQNALDEIQHWPSYTYRLLSGTHEGDYRRFKALLTAEQLRVSRLR